MSPTETHSNSAGEVAGVKNVDRAPQSNFRQRR
jgi:hypothetical protein